MLLWSLAGTRVVSDRSNAQDDSECASVEDVEKMLGRSLGEVVPALMTDSAMLGKQSTPDGRTLRLAFRAVWQALAQRWQLAELRAGLITSSFELASPRTDRPTEGSRQPNCAEAMAAPTSGCLRQSANPVQSLAISSKSKASATEGYRRWAQIRLSG